MLADLWRAVVQLGEPSVAGVVLRGLLGALLTLALLVAGVWAALGASTAFEAAWAEWTVDLLGGAAMVLLAWTLYPAAAALMTLLHLERVAAAVEAKHYPDLPPPRAQPLAEAVGSGLRIAGLAALLNLAALPIYLVAAPLAPLVFAAINGWLLGREYFEQAALRRLPPAEATALRRRHSGAVLRAGLVLAATLAVPFVNLVAPALAAAFMTHRFERLRRAP